MKIEEIIIETVSKPPPNNKQFSEVENQLHKELLEILVYSQSSDAREHYRNDIPKWYDQESSFNFSWTTEEYSGGSCWGGTARSQHVLDESYAFMSAVRSLYKETENSSSDWADLLSPEESIDRSESNSSGDYYGNYNCRTSREINFPKFIWSIYLHQMELSADHYLSVSLEQYIEASKLTYDLILNNDV